MIGEIIAFIFVIIMIIAMVVSSVISVKCGNTYKELADITMEQNKLLTKQNEKLSEIIKMEAPLISQTLKFFKERSNP